LCAGTGTAGFVSPGAADLDVKRGDAEFFASIGDVDGGQHGGVRRRFVSIGLDFHATRDPYQSFASRQVRHVHKRIVKTRKQMRHAKDFFARKKLHATHGLSFWFTVFLEEK
jgi:hypothetical protein